MIIVFVIILNIFFALAISDQVREIAIERTETTNALYLNSLALSDLKLKDFESQNFDDKKNIFMNYYSKIKNEETVRLKVWAKDGTIVYSDDDSLIGQNFNDNARFQSSINGDMTSEIKDPVDPENISEVGYGQLMEIYVPIYLDSIEPIAVIELYYSLDSVNRSIDEVNSIISIVSLILIGLISATITLFSFSVVTISRRNIAYEKLAMMGQLASKISHDLKNPLTILKMLVEQNTLDVTQDDIQTLRNKKMNRAILKMTNQIDNILNFVKDHELILKNISVYSLFDHTIEYVELTSSVKIQKEGNDCLLLCDFYKIETVFENIVLNAIQAMKNIGNITLRSSDTENYTQIIIENDGPDIPDDILPNIFELLFSTKSAGTGLGLNSCRTIIEQHGGTIEVFNTPTRFVLTFPKSSS